MTDERKKAQLARKESLCKEKRPHPTPLQGRSAQEQVPSGAGESSVLQMFRMCLEKALDKVTYFGASPAVSRGFGWRAPEALPPTSLCEPAVLHSCVA